MVILINGELQRNHIKNTKTLFTLYPDYAKVAETFSYSRKKLVEPKGLLYVWQREYAITTPGDENNTFIGSDDATTCIIIIIIHFRTGVTCLSHLDGCKTEEAICEMIKKMKQFCKNSSDCRFSVHLVGGFLDYRGISMNLFSNIMLKLHEIPEMIDLNLACVGEANTCWINNRPWPRVYGVAVEVRTGHIFPATFKDKGPDELLRSARPLAGCDNMLDVYDNDLRLLRIGPFTYTPLFDIDYFLNVPDGCLLQAMSTSPDVEPPGYTDHIRKTLEFIRDNPDLTTSVFKQNQPHYFCREKCSGLWIPIFVNNM